ncbi:MAG TPA: arsenate reductase ArsC [Herpetosiphonaceae bacterium]
MAEPAPAADPAAHAAEPVRVLFLCTQNSARSQMAEAMLRHLAGGQAIVASAGTEPGAVHPLALRTLAAHGVDAAGLASKHLDTFAGQDFDYIVTVCDRARESCPIFPGDPERIHWSFADPAAIDDPDGAERAFEQTFVQLQTRLRYLLTLIARQRRDG